jgi:hypothetical protein
MSGRPGNIFLTSDKSRIEIPACSSAARSHAIVLFSAGDNSIRLRALAEIKRLAKEADNNGAAEVLVQFTESTIDLGNCKPFVSTGRCEISFPDSCTTNQGLETHGDNWRRLSSRA